MTDNYSNARQRAEIAYGKTQTQALARDRTISESDAVTQARNEKTMRLRALRLSKEQEAAAEVAKKT